MRSMSHAPALGSTFTVSLHALLDEAQEKYDQKEAYRRPEKGGDARVGSGVKGTSTARPALLNILIPVIAIKTQRGDQVWSTLIGQVVMEEAILAPAFSALTTSVTTRIAVRSEEALPFQDTLLANTLKLTVKGAIRTFTNAGQYVATEEVGLVLHSAVGEVALNRLSRRVHTQRLDMGTQVTADTQFANVLLTVAAAADEDGQSWMADALLGGGIANGRLLLAAVLRESGKVARHVLEDQL